MDSLTENAYDGLVIHLAIAINRILQQDVIQVTGDWQEKLPRDEDYRLASRIGGQGCAVAACSRGMVSALFIFAKLVYNHV